MTISTTTATTPNLQFATTSNPATTGVGLPQNTMTTTNQNAVITPAPVTIVRSSPIPPDSSGMLPQQPEAFSQSSSTTSGLGTQPLGGVMVPPLTTYMQTTSGLPTAPPMNFQMPMMPPTISLGPKPSLQTSHTPSSSAQQWPHCNSDGSLLFSTSYIVAFTRVIILMYVCILWISHNETIYTIFIVRVKQGLATQVYRVSLTSEGITSWNNCKQKTHLTLKHDKLLLKYNLYWKIKLLYRYVGVYATYCHYMQWCALIRIVKWPNILQMQNLMMTWSSSYYNLQEKWKEKCVGLNISNR